MFSVNEHVPEKEGTHAHTLYQSLEYIQELLYWMNYLYSQIEFYINIKLYIVFQQNALCELNKVLWLRRQPLL